MKAIAFSLDALFALLIAAAGISVLLFFNYSGQTPSLSNYNTAATFMNQLSSVTAGQALQAGNASWVLAPQGYANESWDQLYNGYGAAAGNPGGPTRQYVAFEIPYETQNGTIVGDYGNIYYEGSSGPGATYLYAVNALNNAQKIWPVEPIQVFRNFYPIRDLALYQGMILVGSGGNPSWLTAMNAYSGNYIYRNVSLGGILVTDMVVYKNDVILATTTKILALNARNGTLDWSYTVPGQQIKWITVNNGTVYAASSGASGNLIALSDIDNSITQTPLWVVPASSLPNPASGVTSDVAVSGNVVGFMNGPAAVALNTSGKLIFQSIIGGSASAYGGTTTYSSGPASIMMYQSGSALASVNITSGSPRILWTRTFESSGAGYNNATPIMSSSAVYTIWPEAIGAMGGNTCPTIVSQNLTNGRTVWQTSVPFWNCNKLNADPYMALVDGDLFVDVMKPGSPFGYLLNFGSCYVNPKTSLLVAIATLYVNNQQGCANYILDQVNPKGNYTFFAGNYVSQYAMGPNPPHNFPWMINVSNSAPLPAINLGSNSMSISAWVFPAIETTSPNYPRGAQIFANVITSTCTNIGLLENWTSYSGLFVDAYFSSQPAYLYLGPKNGYRWNRWYNIVVTYNGFGNSVAQVYVNGNQVGTLNSSNAGTISNCNGVGQIHIMYPRSTTFDNGFFMANLQTYNTQLTRTQVNQLYGEGLFGAPVTGNYLSWYPLAGDANDYGTVTNETGFLYLVGSIHAGYYNNVNYTPPLLNKSSQVSVSDTYLSLLNYTTGSYNLYKVGVYSYN
ncbi:MAG: PQQ-binding-like beta-propeller repeat protein [Candidatus Micrarchaeota archaeon]|nr:PQQ-binding-like beta-propeller repeat protein [Candidatus Micrarchaeota archaeon]